jgi:hypothetical protein
MKVLLVGHHVQRLAEVVGLLAVEHGGKSRVAYRDAPSLTQNQQGGHAAGRQIDDLRAFAQRQKPFSRRHRSTTGCILSL